MTICVTSIEGKKNVDPRIDRSAFVYIGRGSPFGNPYKIGRDGTREEVIEKFRLDLRAAYKAGSGPLFKAFMGLVERYQERKDIVLVCHCKPLPCHGDVIKEAVQKTAVALRGAPGPILRRVGFSGDRSTYLTDQDMAVLWPSGPIQVVVGDCVGVDDCVIQYAINKGVQVCVHSVMTAVSKAVPVDGERPDGWAGGWAGTCVDTLYRFNRNSPFLSIKFHGPDLEHLEFPARLAARSALAVNESQELIAIFGRRPDTSKGTAGAVRVAVRRHIPVVAWSSVCPPPPSHSGRWEKTGRTLPISGWHEYRWEYGGLFKMEELAPTGSRSLRPGPHRDGQDPCWRPTPIEVIMEEKYAGNFNDDHENEVVFRDDKGRVKRGVFHVTQEDGKKEVAGRAFKVPILI